jgi:hypothetical protein
MILKEKNKLQIRDMLKTLALLIKLWKSGGKLNKL